MSGRAKVVVHSDLLARLVRYRPLFEQIVLHSANPFGPHTYILDLSSDALASDCSGCQDMVIEGDTISFRPGDEFVPANGPSLIAGDEA